MPGLVHFQWLSGILMSSQASGGVAAGPAFLPGLNTPKSCLTLSSVLILPLLLSGSRTRSGCPRAVAQSVPVSVHTPLRGCLMLLGKQGRVEF